uniref:Uncharacterized protein n=1 Tax=Anguilla anguilla TaxID=7936 RepID=A0A0E9VKL7_ANGAN
MENICKLNPVSSPNTHNQMYVSWSN